jgi:hypothetical protein
LGHPVRLEVSQNPVPVVELDQEPPIRLQRPGHLREHRPVLSVVEVAVRGEPPDNPVELRRPRQPAHVAANIFDSHAAGIGIASSDVKKLTDRVGSGNDAPSAGQPD